MVSSLSTLIISEIINYNACMHAHILNYNSSIHRPIASDQLITNLSINVEMSVIIKQKVLKILRFTQCNE